MGEGAVTTHMMGKKHRQKLTKLNTPLEGCKTAQSDEIKKSHFDSIAMNESKPLIGLGYVVELFIVLSNVPNFVCVLCDKRCDLNSITSHLTSHRHRMKYLVRFPFILLIELQGVPVKIGMEKHVLVFVRTPCE